MIKLTATKDMEVINYVEYQGKFSDYEMTGWFRDLHSSASIKVQDNYSTRFYCPKDSENKQAIELPKCSIASSIIKEIKERADTGLDKYGVTLDRDDLTPEEWIQHAKEEALDFVAYLTKLKQVIKDKE